LFLPKEKNIKVRIALLTFVMKNRNLSAIKSYFWIAKRYKIAMTNKLSSSPHQISVEEKVADTHIPA
jgi:hypothetical protein